MPKTAIVPLTSDKGLCGGINSTVVKYTKIVDKLAADDGADVPPALCRSLRRRSTHTLGVLCGRIVGFAERVRSSRMVQKQAGIAPPAR